MTRDELRGRLAELDKQKADAQRELGSLRDDQRYLEYLNDIPTLVAEHLEYLPHYIATPVRKPPDTDNRDADGKIRLYTITPETAKPRPELDIDQEAESQKWRGLYEQLGLKLIKRGDGGLEAVWGPDPLAQKAVHP